MSAYLRNWLFAGAATTEPEREPEVTLHISPPQSPSDRGVPGEEDDDGDSDDRSDTPPAFPALGSAQRAAAPALAPAEARAQMRGAGTGVALPKVLTDAQLMPPPPLPSKALRVPGVPAPLPTASSSRSASLSVPSSSSSLLALPASTSRLPAKKFREKVELAPGFGPLDWAALKATGEDLRVCPPLAHHTRTRLMCASVGS